MKDTIHGSGSRLSNLDRDKAILGATCNYISDSESMELFTSAGIRQSSARMSKELLEAQ
jgi:hypothetical protein